MLPEWLLKFTRTFEEFRPKAYLDSENKWTIGFGTRFYPDGKEVKEGDTVTKEQAEKYFQDFYTKNLNQMSKIFPKWETFPEQVKAALLDISYRGGINNFALKSPMFTKKVNQAAEDGTFTKDELNSIVREIDYSGKTGNLLDRFDRRVAMLYGVYNTDNYGINQATTVKSPYRNIRANINYPGNIYETLQKVNQSPANFVGRLKDPERQTIPDWETDKEATHKLSYVTESNDKEGDYDVVFPMVQEEREYPWYDPFHWTDGEPVLKDYTNPDYKEDAYQKAVEKQDTVHVPSGMGEFFTIRYKRYYPGFNLNGGNINYLKCF